MTEMRFAAAEMEKAGLPKREAQTVFFGGGTPTQLPAEQLALMLGEIKSTFGLASGAEVTTEANPDTVDREYLETLKEAGFTRLSVGMQSAVPHVLQALDRTHKPENVGEVVRLAKEIGLQVSVDLIYGAPGETIENWQTSLETALGYEPNHISAYALIIEQGTKLERQIRRGEVVAPDDDLQAEMYELADQMLQDAGFEWYEISNWAKSREFVSRHNLAYWQNTDWWGIGPGAHSHINGERWSNVKHPAAYAARIAAGESPEYERETLSAESKLLETILLQTRVATGMQISLLPSESRQKVAELISAELIDGRAALAGRIVLTLKGRLLADVVVHKLTEHL